MVKKLASKSTPEKEMSFLDHLEELRWHLVRSAIAITVIAVVLFVNVQFVFDKILLLHKDSEFITYRLICKLSYLIGMSDSLCANDINVTLQSIKVMEQFTSHIFVSVIGGLVCAFPYVYLQIWNFIKPGLREEERKSASGIVFFGSFLFMLGILFGFFLITPLSVQFFGNYKMHESIENQFTINSYISMVTSTTFACGVIFQLPIVVYILSKLGVLTPQFMRKYRKHAIVIVLLLSAIITPPDIISQILVTLPLLLLYEISIMISRSVNKGKELEEEDDFKIYQFVFHIKKPIFLGNKLNIPFEGYYLLNNLYFKSMLE